MEEKWEVTWHFGSYELGWYAKKLFVYLPIHFAIGFVTMFITYKIFEWNFWFCFFAPLLVGFLIELYQCIRDKFTWSQRQAHLLGHIRDVVTYMTFSWIIFLF